MRDCIEFRYNRCRMALNIPEALENMPIPNIRKILNLAMADGRNDESIARFFRCIPDVLSDLRARWEEASVDFRIMYRDEKYDENGNYIRDKDERKKRHDHNRRLWSTVKAAKANYEHFQNRVPKLEALKN